MYLNQKYINLIEKGKERGVSGNLNRFDKWMFRSRLA